MVAVGKGRFGKEGDGRRALGLMKDLPRRVLAFLANLPLAIGEMFTTAGSRLWELSLIKLRFITWRWVFTQRFDHMFSSPVFLGMLALLGTSLMVCTCAIHIPIVNVSKRSIFLVSWGHP